MTYQWVKYEDGKTIGTIGSESGTILDDEEYMDRCRITLEKTKQWYAITCGVYGGFVHAVFANDMDYKKKYEAMKMDLVEFIESDVEYSETFEFYHMFTSKY